MKFFAIICAFAVVQSVAGASKLIPIPYKKLAFAFTNILIFVSYRRDPVSDQQLLDISKALNAADVNKAIVSLDLQALTIAGNFADLAPNK